MTLTKEEERLVLEYRERIQLAKERIAKQKSCTHDWRYRGEWRGDSRYECFNCGRSKWE